MSQALLTLNAGSSSLKFRLFGLTPALPYLVGGKVTGIGGAPEFQVHWQETSRDEHIDLPAATGIDEAIDFVLDWLERETTGVDIAVAAHRIVHGGKRDQAVELLPDTIEELAAYAPLAPQHQPHNLAAVKAMWRTHPRLRQFGCFDTAFHAHLGPLATRLALPDSVTRRGVRRYGYHGLSFTWVADSLRRSHPDLFAGRVVAAHLGNGSSLCAMRSGLSVDTSMGLTALDGLPMGTRCGAIDPGAILHMQNDLGLTVGEVQQMLYEESGLKGLSGISNDVRTLLNSDNPRARFALDYLAHKTAQGIAAMAVSLGGLDGVVFTGGIGENAAPVRDMIIAALGFLPPFKVLVVPANEERAMAAQVAGLLQEVAGDA